MFVERCKEVVNVDYWLIGRLLVTDRENDEDQVTVTIFDLTLGSVVKIDLSISQQKIEDKLMDDLKKHGFMYKTNFRYKTKKKQIVTSVIKHENYWFLWYSKNENCDFVIC